MKRAQNDQFLWICWVKRNPISGTYRPIEISVWISPTKSTCDCVQFVHVCFESWRQIWVQLDNLSRHVDILVVGYETIDLNLPKKLIALPWKLKSYCKIWTYDQFWDEKSCWISEIQNVSCCLSVFCLNYEFIWIMKKSVVSPNQLIEDISPLIVKQSKHCCIRTNCWSFWCGTSISEQIESLIWRICLHLNPCLNTWCTWSKCVSPSHCVVTKRKGGQSCQLNVKLSFHGSKDESNLIWFVNSQIPSYCPVLACELKYCSWRSTYLSTD